MLVAKIRVYYIKVNRKINNVMAHEWVMGIMREREGGSSRYLDHCTRAIGKRGGCGSFRFGFWLLRGTRRKDAQDKAHITTAGPRGELPWSCWVAPLSVRPHRAPSLLFFDSCCCWCRTPSAPREIALYASRFTRRFALCYYMRIIGRKKKLDRVRKPI